MTDGGDVSNDELTGFFMTPLLPLDSSRVTRAESSELLS